MSRIPLLLFLLAACASSSGRERHASAKRWPELAAPAEQGAAEDLTIFAARRPDAEQAAELDQAIRVYVEEGDEAFARDRDRLAGNPVTAFWLARTLGLFAVEALSRSSQVGLQLAGEPAWARPVRHIVAMGEAAVPFVIIDLLEHGLPDRRDLGEQILADMGSESLPAWDFILESGDLRMRRLGMSILAEMQPAAASLPYLEKGTGDADFGVRASAFRGLGRAGEHMAPRMRAALDSEQDPFVLRAIVQSMSNFKDAASAEALVVYMDRALRAGDIEEARNADRVLREMSGETGSRDPAGWRAWIRGAFDGS